MGEAGVGRSQGRIPSARGDFHDHCSEVAAAEAAAVGIPFVMLYSLDV